MEELIDKLKKCMELKQAAYESYTDASELEANARQELKEYMHSTGLLSAKTKDLTASIVSKPTIEIKHETSVLTWLQETPEIETDHYIGLRLTEFKKLALHRLKETGEIIPGTEMVVNDTLAIRKK